MNEAAEELFERALGVPPAARAALLADLCPEDATLRNELLSLLEHAEAADRFFGRVLDPIIGRLAGHYQILARLGSGGMGSVYRARDMRLDREVALKFLPLRPIAAPDAAQRLLAEARAAAALQHPNVCVVFDFGETEQRQPFIVMALCDGETLRETLRNGPLPFDQVVSISAQIARGLGAAHARGIVHRDVKPANVMLTNDGTVKLLDFGLAAANNERIAGVSSTAGTPAYMSPEQLRGEPLDHRTDLWSLGVVLYEMVAGERPFHGRDDRALAQAILHEEPPALVTRRPDVPQTLVAIVERLLRKDPGVRTATTGELLTDLAVALTPRRGPLPSNEPQRLDAVMSYEILDTPPEAAYDELTELAARLCGVPVAYIKFFDDARAWFKSTVGLPADLIAVPREASICNTTICQHDLVVIPDCSADDRFRDNPTVAGWPHIRFYCGMPLTDSAGFTLGTFCIFDYAPRELSAEHRGLIRALARQVVSQLELRLASIQLDRTRRDLALAKRELEAEQARSKVLADDLHRARAQRTEDR